MVKYGHVGRRNEISVPRYLETPATYNLIEVLEIVGSMPGVKKVSGIMGAMGKAEEVNEATYLQGKEEEKENLYLKKLMSFNPHPEKMTA